MTDRLKNVCRVHYAPAGEYIKDHCLIRHDNLWHFFSISGGIGYSWEDIGHEERISHSTSRDLIDWKMRGHPVQASRQPGFYDEHLAVAPFVLRGHDGLFYMFYSGWRHPHKRPNFRLEGHHQSIYLAVSKDLYQWEIPETVKSKGILVADGELIVGRDPHVIRDEERNRWLLYYTEAGAGRRGAVGVAESQDLLSWRNIGAATPVLTAGWTCYNPAESPFIIRHPRSGKYLLLLNWHYAISDDPAKFQEMRRLPFRCGIDGSGHDMKGVGVGFAREIIDDDGQMYMSGVMEKSGYAVLGFTAFSWTDEFLKLESEDTGAYSASEPVIN